MEQNQSTQAEPELFKEEVKRAEVNKYIYFILGGLNLLIAIVFWKQSGSLLVALLWSLPLSVIFSALFISTVHVGNRTFWLNFSGILFLLICFCCFGIPGPIMDFVDNSGIPSEILIFGSIIQVVLFYGYISYQQIKDTAPLTTAVDADEIRIRSKLKKKEAKPQKKKKIRKAIGQRFKIGKAFKRERQINEHEPEIYRKARREAMRLGVVLTSVIVLLMFKDAYQYELILSLFISIMCGGFFMAVYLLLVSMIKPGTKKFWIFVAGFAVFIVPIFLTFQFYLQSQR